MPKVKVAKKSVFIDMTPMVDMAFLLVTFFMLATTFRPEEPVIVDLPQSVDSIPLPDVEVMQITFSKDGRVFITCARQETKLEWIKEMEGSGMHPDLALTPEEEKKFSLLNSFGMPISSIKEYLDTKPEERRSLFEGGEQPGIPTADIDGDSLHTELGDWIKAGMVAGNRIAQAKYPGDESKGMRIAIKGDRDADYTTVKRVLKILVDNKDFTGNRYNFVTNLDGAQFMETQTPPK